MIRAARLIVALLLFALPFCYFGGPAEQQDDYAAWSSVEPTGTWTLAAEAAIGRTSIARQDPADIGRFGPRYSELGQRTRVKFRAGLLSAIAKVREQFRAGDRLLREHARQQWA